MNFHRLNWLGVLVAAIYTMVVGFLWYSPILFANAWMRELGHDANDKAKIQEMQKTAGLAYTGSFLASLVSASTLALFLHWLRAEGLHIGLMVGFHVWLGFFATVPLTGVLFMKPTINLFAVNTAYHPACHPVIATTLPR